MPSSLVTAIGLILIGWSMRGPVTSIPPVLGRLGLDHAGQTLLVTIPVLSFGLGALAGPVLRRRFGEERAIFGLVFLALLGLCLRALSPGRLLFPGTLLAMLAIATLNVLIPSFIKRRFPQRLGTIMAVYTAALTTGAAIGAGLAIPLLRAAGGSPAAPLGFWTLTPALGLLLWLPQLRRAVTALARQHEPMTRLRSLWRNRLAWHVLIYMGSPGVLIFYGPVSWLPSIYAARGVNPAQAGFLLMAMSLSCFIGNLAAPLLATRMRDQRVAVSVNLLLALAGLFGVLLGPTAWALLWVILLGISQGAGLSLSLLLIVLRAGDGDTAARLSSMSQAGGYTIGALGTLAMGLLASATGGWSVPLLFLIAAMVASWPSGLIAARKVTI